MNKRRVAKEVLDFAAHGSSAFLGLFLAQLLGVWWTDLGAILIAWAFGFVREFTEWQDGGRHPFTPFGLLDQAGWVAGGVAYCVLVLG